MVKKSFWFCFVWALFWSSLLRPPRRLCDRGRDL